MNIEEIVTQPIAQGSPGPCPAPIHANLPKARQTDRGLDRRESLQRAYRTDLAARFPGPLIRSSQFRESVCLHV
jgi:hypothetical protein